MNLKKFTKAELISKIQGLKDNNPNYQSKLFNFFYLIKQFLVKITLITLIIKIFKRFSILRRIWLITNTIVMSIFGISMLDIYGLSIFSAFFAEISYISSNIINYLSNTKFYALISGLLGQKIDTPHTPQTRMSSVDKSSTGSEKSPKIIERFNKIIHKEEEIIPTEVEIIEDSYFYNNKYFICGCFFLISGVAYYYFGDEIKVYALTAWGYLRGRRPGDEGDNPPNNPTNRFNSISDFLGLNQNNSNDGNILAQMVEADGSEAIEIINQTTTIPSSSILTSPSLENLNTTAAETWSNSRPTSPQSTSSTSSNSTIRQANIPILRIDTEVSNSSIPPSYSASILPITPDGYIDEAYTPNEDHLKPFVTVEAINDNPLYVYNETNWKSFANKGVQDRMQFVESVLTNSNLKDLNQEQLYKLHDKATDIAQAYNEFVKGYNSNRNIFDEDTSQPLKYFAYLMRGWLQKHLAMIWPDENINIPLGDRIDSPNKITNEIFNIQAHVPSDDSSDTDSN